MKNLLMTVALVGLSACTDGAFGLGGVQNVAAVDAVATPVAAAAPPQRPEVTTVTAAPPPAAARTVEQFDTTTAEDRAEAVSASSGGAKLGTTIANLGNPTDPGIWLRTPLVSEVQQGRVEYKGNSVNVELRPSGGVAGSGSQISLAAIRLIEAPLTSLPEVTVYAN